ncbi:MAG: serine/threonine-protein kinase [Myxococcota bacterium]
MCESAECPDDNELAAFAQGVDGADDHARIEAHARGCPACADLIEELAQTETSAPKSAPATLLGPGDRLGRYEIVGIVGAGSMGVVYRARDPELERELAIKVVPTAGAAEVRGRAEREAKALARLAHPNVLTVLDVGVQSGSLYIATEFVDGPNLERWLDGTRRTPEEVLTAFVAVVDALAAAHAAGLVHRDVKPANIFVGSDGRIRLGDFGLAHVGPVQVTAAVDPAEPRLDTLTQTGTVVGTPRYMAPEQLLNEPADARADQFALCVALYDALWGRFPFAGEDFATLRDNVIAGELRPPPVGTAVPTRVRAAVIRGLARSPSDRHASMGALRAELVRPRRRAWVIGGIAAVAIAGGWIWMNAAGPRACEDPGQALGETWSDGRREAVRGAFGATAMPYADAALEEVSAGFDAFVGAWGQAYTQACGIADDDPRAFDATMACLARVRSEAAALSKLLADADDARIEGASAAVARLPTPARCETADSLPEDPETRAAIASIHDELAELSALEHTAEYEEGRRRAAIVAKRVEEIDHLPTRAEVLLTLGLFQRKAATAKEAEATYRAAVMAAESSDAAELAARGLAALVFVVGAQRHRYEETEAFIRQAEAMLKRAGDPPRLVAQLREATGAMALGRADHDRAQAAYEEAHRIRLRMHGADSLRAASGLNNLGAVAAARGEFEAGAARFQEALALYERHLGSEHPDVADALTNLGAMYRAQKRYPEAREALQRALRVREVTVGPDDPDTGAVVNNLGNVHLFERDYDGALEHYRRALAIYARDPEANAQAIGDTNDSLGATYGYLEDRARAVEHFGKALSIRESLLGPDHLHVARTQHNLARVLTEHGDAARAAELLHAAVSTFERVYGPDHRVLAIGLDNLGNAQLANGALTDARDAYLRALAIHDKNPEADGATRSPPLLGLGRVARAAGERAKAIEWLEKAAAALDDGSSAPRLAEATFELAQALAEAPAQRERARSVGERARTQYSEMGDEGVDALAEVDALLASLQTP